MDTQPLEILKWIGIVLAAGFVGYFERYLAMKILGQAQKNKLPAPSSQPDESQLKLEKKKAKQALSRPSRQVKSSRLRLLTPYSSFSIII